MLEALQAEQEILTLPVLAQAVPRSQGKPTLGPFSSTLASTVPLPIVGDIPPPFTRSKPSCLGVKVADALEPSMVTEPWARAAGFKEQFAGYLAQTHRGTRSPAGTLGLAFHITGMPLQIPGTIGGLATGSANDPRDGSCPAHHTSRSCSSSQYQS